MAANMRHDVMAERLPIVTSHRAAMDDQTLLAVPSVLTTDDGRRVKLTLWEPRVAVDEAVTVRIEGILVRPNS